MTVTRRGRREAWPARCPLFSWPHARCQMAERRLTNRAVFTFVSDVFRFSQRALQRLRGKERRLWAQILVRVILLVRFLACCLRRHCFYLIRHSGSSVLAFSFQKTKKRRREKGDDEQMDGHPSSVRGVCLLLIVWCTLSLGQGEGRRYSRLGKYSFLFVFLFNYA